jgi:hypothetical protein
MKNLVVIGAVVASVVGCAGYQSKIENAQMKARDTYAKVVCRAKVVAPYVDLILEQDLPAILEGSSIDDLLAMSGAVKDEADKVKAAFATCGKIEL